MSRKYKFIYSTAVDISIDNGPGINEREFINEILNRYCDEVTCVVPYPDHPEVHWDRRIKYVVNHRRHSFGRYFVYSLGAFNKIRKLHRREGFDAAVFRLEAIPLSSLMVAYWLRMPIILKTVAGFLSFSKFSPARNRLVANFALPMYRMICRHATFADTVSKAYLEWLPAKYGIKKGVLSLIPNSANTELFTPGPKAETRQALGLQRYEYIVGYVGAMSVVRNVDRLVKAAKIVKERVKIGLVLVGDGPDRKYLERMASQLGLADDVVFAGSIEYRRVREYLQALDVAVDLTMVPMKVGSKVINASYSQKIAQYLACGVPVIACDVDDNRFIRRERLGELVNPYEVGDVAVAIQKLAASAKNEEQILAKRCREYAVGELSVRSAAEKRLDLWRRTVNQYRVRCKM